MLLVKGIYPPSPALCIVQTAMHSNIMLPIGVNSKGYKPKLN